MLPAPQAFKRGCASWQRWKTDSKLVLKMVENSSAVYSSVGFHEAVPTLLT
jgi:hypothetical protein